jgi:hypothetical protein
MLKHLVAAALLSLTACSSGNDASPAYGLFENGEHHVATFSGFVDNFEGCQLAADAFNTESARDPAAWAAIGKKPDTWVCAKL